MLARRGGSAVKPIIAEQDGTDLNRGRKPCTPATGIPFQLSFLCPEIQRQNHRALRRFLAVSRVSRASQFTVSQEIGEGGTLFFPL